MSDERQNQELQIRALLERYSFAIDSRDEAMLASCFTVDATAHYHKGFVTEVFLKTAAEISRFLLQRTSVYSATNHLISNARIEIDKTTARVEMHVIAHCIVSAQPKVLVRGIRYEDDLVRETRGWSIRHRVHVPQWQYEAATVPPAIPVAK
jgi:hypothetical protein